MNWFAKWFKTEHTPHELRELRKECALCQVHTPGVKKLISEYCDTADIDDTTYGYWNHDKTEWVLAYVEKFIWDTLYVNGSIVYHPNVPVEEPTIALANSLVNDDENWKIVKGQDGEGFCHSCNGDEPVFNLTYAGYGQFAVNIDGFTDVENNIICLAAIEFKRKHRDKLNAKNRAKIAAIFQGGPSNADTDR